MQTSSKEIIIGIFSATILLVVIVGFILFLIVYFRKRQKNFIREKEEMKKQFEKTHLTSMLEVQEQTFKNISLEIHDNIGQVLSLAKLSIGTAVATDFEEKAVLAKDLITKAISDLRDMSKSLNTNQIANEGLSMAIARELQMLEKTGKYKTELIGDDEINVPAKNIVIIFRIIQEAFNNIIKHAVATAIVVELKDTATNATIKINDNGKGFDVDLATKTNMGLGLKTMIERSKFINGTTFISSSIGSGTTITINIDKKEND